MAEEKNIVVDLSVDPAPGQKLLEQLINESPKGLLVITYRCVNTGSSLTFSSLPNVFLLALPGEGGDLSVAIMLGNSATAKMFLTV